MIFYLVMGGLFALYGLDLLLLVCVSAIARSQEIAALLVERHKHRRHHKKHSSHRKAASRKGGHQEQDGSKAAKQAEETAATCQEQQQKGKPGLPDLKLEAPEASQRDGGAAGEDFSEGEFGLGEDACVLSCQIK